MKPDARETATALVLGLGKPKMAPSKSDDDDGEDDEGSSLADAAGESAADDALSAMKGGDSAGFYAAMKAMFDCMKD